MPRILVVDDEEAVRKFLIDTLKFAGYDILTAGDGITAMNIAEQTIPDLIISDIQMPRMDGYTMMDELHNRPKTNTIPIILLTIENDKRDIRRGMVRGADDYLPKPVDPGDVLAAVQTQLQKRAVIEEKHDTNLQTLRRNIVYALPHEFRTPLGVILGYAQMMEMDHHRASPEDILESAQAISSAGERLEHLIENYLVYAQLEVIQLDAIEREAARNHLVKNAGTIIGDAAQQKAVAYDRLPDLQLDAARMALRISEDNLKKIVHELVDNAFKFSTRGTPVEVKAFQEDQSFVLSIRDYGRGMTASNINQMGAYMQFGREFFEQQGVGLGFTIAKRLANLHDGDLQVVSQPKQGTHITIRFPAF